MDVHLKTRLMTLALVGLLIGSAKESLGQFPGGGGQFRPSNSVSPSNPASQSVTQFGNTGFASKTANDAPFAGSQTTKINWVDGKNIQQAMQMAIQQNKPLMLHFWNERCKPCMALEQFVFPNPLLAQAINSQFIPVKVNTTETPEIHQKYKVSRWPWDVFVSPSGAKLLDRASPNNASQYTQNVNSVAKMHRNFMKFATASNPTGAPNNLKTSTTNQFGTQANFQANGGFKTGQAASAGGSRHPNGIAGDSLGQNPVHFNSQANTIQFNHQQKSAGGTSVANKFFPGNQKQSAQNRVAQNQVQVAGGQLPQGGKSVVNNSGPPASVSKPPSIGLEGYCPVTLLKEIRKVPGSKDWGCVHRGKLYFFANESYRRIFMKDPDRYAPVLAGYDVVIYRETGKLVEGKSIYGGFVGEKDNRLVFLFANEENKKKFISDKTDRYVEAARIATKNTSENWLR